MEGIYTDKERREILAGAAEYDRRIDDELRARGAKPADPFVELYRALEDETLEAIRFYTQDIGFMLKLREAFASDARIREWARHLVNLMKHEIQTLTEEVIRAREEADRLKDL